MWLTMTNQRLSRRLAELELTHQQLQTSSLDLKAAAARAQAVLDMLTSPQTSRWTCRPRPRTPCPTAKRFTTVTADLLFYTTNLNSLPSDRTYEFWLIPTVGKPVDVGIFNTDTQGNGQLILTHLPRVLPPRRLPLPLSPPAGFRPHRSHGPCRPRFLNADRYHDTLL